MKLFGLIFVVYLSYAHSQTDVSADNLELGATAPEKNHTKTWGTIFPGENELSKHFLEYILSFGFW